MYDDNNLLFVAELETTVASSGSFSFDGFEPHRIVFFTQNSDEFAATISVEQDGTDVTSLFTCIDCAPGTQSVSLSNIYLDDVADIGQSATACDGDCEFVRSGTTVTEFHNGIQGGTGDLGFVCLDEAGAELYRRDRGFKCNNACVAITDAQISNFSNN